MKPVEFLKFLYRNTDSVSKVEFRAFKDGKKNIKFSPLANEKRLEIAVDMFIESNKDANCFFGVGPRLQGSDTGTKEDVAYIPALWCDVDFKNTSRDDLAEKYKSFPFKPSITIKSGHGIHFYWILSEPSEPDEFETVEGILKRIQIALGGDPAVCEVARIMRLPGTMNVKSSPAVPCTVNNFENYEYSLDDFLCLPEPEKDAFQPSGNVTTKNDKLNRIMGCKWLQHCRDDAETLDEPQWYAMITQFAKEGEAGWGLIHELSKNHPKYSKAETQKKILQAVAKSGPMTCRRIKSMWDCRKDCGVFSPAALAFPKKEEPRQQGKTVSVSPGVGDRIRNYITRATGKFSEQAILNFFNLRNSDAAEIVAGIIQEKLGLGTIVPAGDRHGEYVKVDDYTEEIDPFTIEVEPLPLALPLNLNDKINVIPGNVIVIAGEGNCGKSTFCMDIIYRNYGMLDMPIQYLSSETDAKELRRMMTRFRNMLDVPIEWWPRCFKARRGNFAPVLDPDGLNIIDYLDITDNFWTVKRDFEAIQDKLNNGVAVVAMQKNGKSDLARGGSFTLDIPRLYISLSKKFGDDGKSMFAKIVKAKDWGGETSGHHTDPNGMVCKYDLIGGADIQNLIDWHWPKK